MDNTQTTIPALLKEKLVGGFELKDILGYKYSSGYWEDDGSWDCPIRDFIEEPVILVYVVNDKNDLLISIEKKDLLQDSYADFENLHQWLKDKYGKGDTGKTDGVFGIVKEFGKYEVEFGRFFYFDDYCFSKGLMIKGISKLLPTEFEFVGDEQGPKWHWVRNNGKTVETNIFCEISLGYDDNYQKYNHIDIWYETDDTSVLTQELDTVCLNIAKMVAVEYPNDMYKHVCVSALYIDIGDMTEIARVEFDVPLNKDEAEKLSCFLFTSEYFYPDNLQWQERELYYRIRKKGEKLLEATFGPQPTARVYLCWGKGERSRLIYGCKSLTEEGIKNMLSYLKSVGNDALSRKDLLRKADGCFVWKEVWTRETGHMWEKYTLLKRTPSDDELDYADCSQRAVWLRDLSTETIVELLKGYKS